MRANRSLWLTPSFLAHADGAAAQARAAALGAAAHEELLARADRIAEASAVLAQQYYRHAAAAWTHFGAEGCRRWSACAEELAAGTPACREGAAAFVALAPEAFGAGGVATAADWCALGRDLLRMSRKLAGIFFQTTGGLLPRPDALPRLRAWAEVARRLYEHQGWHGEFLAQAYLGAAPRAVLALDPDTYQLWAGVGAALAPAVKERDVFGHLPRGLGRWSRAERESYLRGTLTLAAVSPKSAYAFYRDLPGALASVRGAEREALLRLLAAVGKRAAAAVAEFAPLCGATLRQVPPAERLPALALVEPLVAVCPDAVVPALRSLPRLYEEAAPTQVAAWFETGAQLARERPEVGLAYFALESRTSQRVLHAGSTAAVLDEVQGLLRKYVHMLSGEPATLRASDAFTLCPPLEECPAENEVALPLRVDLLDTHEENLRLYRFVAAQLAGRREFGTYTFHPPAEASDPDALPGTALCAYLAGPEQPATLAEFFLLAEGVRIQHRLVAGYRGLAAEALWVASRLLPRWSDARQVSEGRVFDVLFALALAGGALPPPDWLPAAAARGVLRALAPLADPAATVAEAMRIAHALAGQLAAELAPRRAVALGPDAFLLDKVAGDALIDPFFDGEYDPNAGAPAPRVAAPAGGTERPAEIRPQLELRPDRDEAVGGGQALSPEELQRLLAAGVKLEIRQAAGEDVDGLGLYISDLMGKIPSEQLEALRRLLGSADTPARRAPRRWLESDAAGPCFYYDEWDYHIGDYRARWCRLQELALDGDAGAFFTQALAEYASLIPEVRRQFQRVRPEMYRTVRGLEDGEDFDLNAAIDARVDARARQAPSNKLYVARKREERDVATLFLVDMSASTDEPFETAPNEMRRPDRRAGPVRRRIIDVTKAALVIMAAALEEIGDAYAIYGFSGHGREHVEFYRVKSFAELLNVTVKGRIGAIEPKRSTRMGAALRHAIEKMAAVNCRSKHLFLLSDGFPQDHDYGQDRRSNVYGIRDTAVALREAETAGITPFCITVDKAGHDYLREMCDSARYMVIDDIAALPRELPKIYQRVVRA